MRALAIRSIRSLSLAAVTLATLGALGALGALGEREARACGGCFAPPGENESAVNDHKMILSISSEQTTLWDQIEYSGSPSSFAWVLPVSDSKVATLGLSADVVFASLGTLTQTTVQAPPLNCPPPPNCYEGGGSGSGGLAAGAASDAGAAPPGVEVNKQEVVGPYDVAFLHSTDANALNQWLTDHGFGVPADVQPVIGAYVNEHYDFIAMKLVPGAGVQAMRPVRVTTPGAAPVLPLRMVAAGTGSIVPITLWVIGDGRWDPQNFQEFTITSDQLVWDWSTSSSNYKELRDQQNATTHNTQWELESSIPLQQFQLETLIRNGGTPFGGGVYDAGADYAPIDPTDAGPDGGSAPGETADQVREDDITALFAGVDTNAMRVTRMRADLAHASLANDLVLAAGDQSTLSNIRTPTKEANEPQCPVYQGCEVVGYAPRSQAGGQSMSASGVSGPSDGKSSFSCASSPQPLNGKLALGIATILGLVIARARRRRR